MIVVTVHRNCTEKGFSQKKVEKIVSYVCSKEKITDAVFSFVYTRDTEIRNINKKFLNHNYVTDVITFSFGINKVEAEIYISIPQARRQASDFGVTKKNEIMRLIVHGVLHSLGYSDIRQTDKKNMVRIQERYVRELSLMKY